MKNLNGINGNDQNSAINKKLKKITENINTSIKNETISPAFVEKVNDINTGVSADLDLDLKSLFSATDVSADTDYNVSLVDKKNASELSQLYTNILSAYDTLRNNMNLVYAHKIKLYNNLVQLLYANYYILHAKESLNSAKQYKELSTKVNIENSALYQLLLKLENNLHLLVEARNNSANGEKYKNRAIDIINEIEKIRSEVYDFLNIDEDSSHMDSDGTVHILKSNVIENISSGNYIAVGNINNRSLVAQSATVIFSYTDENFSENSTSLNDIYATSYALNLNNIKYTLKQTAFFWGIKNVFTASYEDPYSTEEPEEGQDYALVQSDLYFDPNWFLGSTTVPQNDGKMKLILDKDSKLSFTGKTYSYPNLAPFKYTDKIVLDENTFDPTKLTHLSDSVKFKRTIDSEQTGVSYTHICEGTLRYFYPKDNEINDSNYTFYKGTVSISNLTTADTIQVPIILKIKHIADRYFYELNFNLDVSNNSNIFDEDTTLKYGFAISHEQEGFNDSTIIEDASTHIGKSLENILGIRDNSTWDAYIDNNPVLSEQVVRNAIENLSSANEEINNDILSLFQEAYDYLLSYNLLSTYLSSKDTSFDDTYVSDINNEISSISTTIDTLASGNNSDTEETSSEDTINSLKSQLLLLSNNVGTIISNICEDIISVTKILNNDYIFFADTKNTYENSIYNTFKCIEDVISDDDSSILEVYSFSGISFYRPTIIGNNSFTTWYATALKYIETNSSSLCSLYLSRVVLPIIEKTITIDNSIDNSIILLENYILQSELYKKSISSLNISESYTTINELENDLLEAYHLSVIKNINITRMPYTLECYAPKISSFNNIDISEIFSLYSQPTDNYKELLINKTKHLWEELFLSINKNNFNTFIPDIISIYKNSDYTIRSLYFMPGFYAALADMKEVLDSDEFRDIYTPVINAINDDNNFANELEVILKYIKIWKYYFDINEPLLYKAFKTNSENNLYLFLTSNN